MLKGFFRRFTEIFVSKAIKDHIKTAVPNVESPTTAKKNLHGQFSDHSSSLEQADLQTQLLPKTKMTANHIHWFRAAAPYINLHRGKTFVIMFGGEALYSDNFQHIIHDIALLHALGIHLVLVHGARPQINENLKMLGIETPFAQHRRVTTREALPAVLNAVGSIRLQIEALLSMGVVNSPMYGARIDVVSGNFVTAKPYGIREGIDFQLTGEVRTIDRAAIKRNLDNQNIILLGPTGYSNTGEVFNLRAEEVATKVAIDLHADKLIFLGQQRGFIDQHGHLVRELIPQDAIRYLAATGFEDFHAVHPAADDKATQVHSAPKQKKSKTPVTISEHALRETQLHLAGAVAACQHTVNRCHLLSYAQDGALLGELFTRDGAGTLVSDVRFEDVRQATIQDVGGLLGLLRPLEEQGILVYRSRERLEDEIEHFAVIERDGTIVACAALYPIPLGENEQKSAEIACVAVHPDYRKSNRGAEILAFMQQRAKQQRIKSLYLLTTHTGHWFMEQGFEKVSMDQLPAARQLLYNFQRNSDVYCKKLS